MFIFTSIKHLIIVSKLVNYFTFQKKIIISFVFLFIISCRDADPYQSHSLYNISSEEEEAFKEVSFSNEEDFFKKLEIPFDDSTQEIKITDKNITQLNSTITHYENKTEIERFPLTKNKYYFLIISSKDPRVSHKSIYEFFIKEEDNDSEEKAYKFFIKKTPHKQKRSLDRRYGLTPKTISAYENMGRLFRLKPKPYVYCTDAIKTYLNQDPQPSRGDELLYEITRLSNPLFFIATEFVKTALTSKEFIKDFFLTIVRVCPAFIDLHIVKGITKGITKLIKVISPKNISTNPLKPNSEKHLYIPQLTERNSLSLPEHPTAYKKTLISKTDLSKESNSSDKEDELSKESTPTKKDELPKEPIPDQEKNVMS